MKHMENMVRAQVTATGPVKLRVTGVAMYGKVLCGDAFFATCVCLHHISHLMTQDGLGTALTYPEKKAKRREHSRNDDPKQIQKAILNGQRNE